MNSTLNSEELAHQVNIIDCMSQIVQNEMSFDGAGDLTFTRGLQEYAAVVVRVPKSSMPSDTANTVSLTAPIWPNFHDFPKYLGSTPNFEKP